MVIEVTLSDRFLIPTRDFEPAYLALYRSGELQRLDERHHLKRAWWN
jgi:hypothetical protein